MKEKLFNGKKVCKKKYCRKQLANTNVLKRFGEVEKLETINIHMIG
jgi:hypothetical protein